MSFSAFQLTRKEVSYDDFFLSDIAVQNCIDKEWWNEDHKPKSFLIYENHFWIACFVYPASVYYHTHIESRGYSSFSLLELEKLLFQFSCIEC